MMKNDRGMTEPPVDYHQTGEFNIARDFKLLLFLNTIGIGLLILSLSALAWYATRMRPSNSLEIFSGNIDGLAGLIRWIGLLLGVVAVMIVLHEGLHGLFFWIFTGKRPVFAIRWSYAYAAAPGCFIPRGLYMVVGLAPLVILTTAGLALIPVVPISLLFFLVLFTALNLAGAVGDIWVVGWLLRKSPSTLVRDFGDQIEVFEPLPRD